MNTGLEVIDVNKERYRDGNGKSHAIEKQKQSSKKAERRKKKRERELKIHRIYTGIAILLCMMIGILGLEAAKAVGTQQDVPVSQERNKEINEEYEKIAEAYQPNVPQKLEGSETLTVLSELVTEYPEFQDIYEHAGEYPEKLLKAFCNNPEMYEFVKGYPESDGSVTGGISTAELEKDYPLFLQWDKRWGYASYGDSMIGIAGCGPTCLSMVIVALAGDQKITPDVVASYSMENGYYVEGTGTAWSLMTDGGEHFGVSANEISLDEYILNSDLLQKTYRCVLI